MEEAVATAPAAGVRFAPSPTGRLHLGNLRSAWISHQIARAWGEPWVLRFEDIDLPRVQAGAREAQLADLQALGLNPDQTLLQSRSWPRHWETFQRAIRERRVYPCFCSRKEVREALEGASSAPHRAFGGLAVTYSGRCRSLTQPSLEHGLPTLAWRFAVGEDPSGCSDIIVARTSPELDAQGLPAEPGSFAPAYHWACAVDDGDGHYRLLVRASDLADVVPQHRAIMHWLAASERRPFDPPGVFHTALITQNDGHRLEKRTRGVTLPELLQSGWTTQRLLECFERSFDDRLLQSMPIGCVYGELKQTLTLKELGWSE